MITDDDPRRGDRPRDRRSAAAHPPDEREGEAHHRLPRGRPRPGRGGAAGQRPGAQGDDPAARPGARLHDGAARLGQVLPDRARRCSTSSPTCWAAGRPRRWSSTTRPPAPATTSRRPPAVARAMVTQYGMTERLGAIKLGDGNAEPFLGRDIGHARNYSEEVAGIVDEETKKLLADARTRRPSTSSRRTATSSTRWSSSCSTRRPSTRSRSPRSSSALRRRAERPAWTGSPDRRPSTIPAGRDPRGDPRPRGRQRLRRPRRQRLRAGRRATRAAWSSPRPAPVATCTATPARVGGAEPPTPPAPRAPPDRRDRRPLRAPADVPGVRPRARRGRRPRAADRDRRGPRARGAARHARPGWPAPTRSSPAGCARRPRTC